MKWEQTSKYVLKGEHGYQVAKYVIADESRYQAWLDMEAIGYPCDSVKEAKERCERHLQIMGREAA
ncbi:hypothetical protein [Pseudomonas luteola]|uniref:hypothetical protein n=1 Tax=Pseudomonas luteola TaxID=47886 RepID=UPI0015E2C00E|nr:hypothetical protein [Pseudomonas zeshuii]MBA1249877.1 hypothetical protein [Pseudomonas zeshuii]